MSAAARKPYRKAPPQHRETRPAHQLPVAPPPDVSQFSDSDDIVSDVSSDLSAFTLSPAPRHRRTNQTLAPGPRGILKRPMGAQQGSDIIRRARSAEPLDQSRHGVGNRDDGSLDRGGNRGNQAFSRSLERSEQKVTHGAS